MKAFTVLICEFCGNEFTRETRYVQYDITHRNTQHWFCSRKCHGQNATAKANPTHILNCEECGKLTTIQDRAFKKHPHHFCSRSCRCTYYNRTGVQITANKLKTVSCITCNKTIIVNKHTGRNTWYCELCKPGYEMSGDTRLTEEYKRKLQNKTKKDREMKPRTCICSICQSEFIGTARTKLCLECRDKSRSEAGKKGGKNSAANQSRRSKNEILFAKELSKIIKCEMLYNEPYFSDEEGYKWDADIIIPELKLAIHWNGPWHYKKCAAKHSVAQVQARDLIKQSVIIRSGFTNYIIRDDGAYSIKKVEHELLKFLNHFSF